VSTFYNDCLGGTGTCDGSDLSSTACFSCLLSQSTAAAPWGAVIDYGDEFELNVGGCYALIGAPLLCAEAAQEQAECEIAACGGSCASATDTALTTCLSSADSGECASYVSSVTANCTTAITGAAGCGGGATTTEAQYDAIAATFCE
jgi:hypothetical protein